MAERTSYEPGTPNWVDLSAPDLEGALAFYGSLFGWEFEDAGEEAGNYHQALLRGRRVAGIGPAQPGGPPMAFWTIYFSGADADALAAAIPGAGGTVAFGPMDVFDQGRMLVGQDPTGAMFGVWQPKAHTGAELVNEHGAFTWDELLTRDLDAAVRFYGAVFGHDFEDLPDAGAGIYQLMKVGDRIVGGIWQMSDEVPPDAPAAWMTYFHVDDADAAFGRVQELGGSIVREPVDSPYGRFAVVADPQGGVFALIQSATPSP